MDSRGRFLVSHARFRSAHLTDTNTARPIITGMAIAVTRVIPSRNMQISCMIRWWCAMFLAPRGHMQVRVTVPVLAHLRYTAENSCLA